MGRLSEARLSAEQALSIGRPRGEPETVGWALALLPFLAWFTGDGVDTSTPAAEAVKVAEETGNPASLIVSLEGLALTYLMTGRPADAAAACERALAVGRDKRTGLYLEASVLAHLAKARLADGDPVAALASADEAVVVSRRQGSRVHECLALLTRAQVRAAGSGSTAAVGEDLDAALTLAGETGALTYEPFIREERGRLRADERELSEATRLYEAIGAAGHARRLEAELAGQAPAQVSPSGSIGAEGQE
jgi:tetratricopeptide (TPR) repeat protein